MTRKHIYLFIIIMSLLSQALAAYFFYKALHLHSSERPTEMLPLSLAAGLGCCFISLVATCGCAADKQPRKISVFEARIDELMRNKSHGVFDGAPVDNSLPLDGATP